MTGPLISGPQGHALVDAIGPEIEAGSDALIAVPSGQKVMLQDVIWNEAGDAGLVHRFRFLAPQIARLGGNIGFDVAAIDMVHLCQNYALPRILGNKPDPDQIIISLSDVAIEFGEATPEATQFFEAYRIEEGACIWDAF